MGPYCVTDNLRLRLRIAVAVTVGSGVLTIATGVFERDAGGLIGGTELIAFYSVLGFFVLHGHQWARWTLFALLIGTVLAGLLFLSFDHRLPWQREVALSLFSFFYVLLAVMIGTPARKLAS